MDLIVDHASNAILTIVDRQTGFLMMSKVPNKTAEAVAKVAYRLLMPYMSKIYTTTTDNGSEFAAHKWLAEKLHLTHPIYFADSFCSWQKGCIEYHNKLIRQYIPKKTDISKLSDNFVLWVQKRLNSRPRKKLKFNTPKQEFFKHFS